MSEAVRAQEDARGRRVVLAGAGHAHLYTIARTREFVRRGFGVTVIAPENFWYSGLATGVLGGRYTPEQDQVNIEALVTQEGGKFIRDRVAAIEPAARRVVLQGGGEVSYDVLSLNVGSESRTLRGEGENVFAIKPLRNLSRLREKLEADRSAGRKVRVVVAGAGASGCEIAANVRALAGGLAEITILSRGTKIAESLSAGAVSSLRRALAAREVAVRENATLSRIEGNVAITETGERHEFDYLVNATGLHAPPLIKESGLEVDERGELIVDTHLRSMGDERVFGGGDCVKLATRSLARIGVYAVREGPILYHNLLATLSGEPLRRFRPQKHFLLILNLGDGVGLASWRHWYWLGKTAFRLKDVIDRRFLAKYQRRIGTP